MKRIGGVGFYLLGLLLSTAVALAATVLPRSSPFLPLSLNHTDFGISQFTAGTLNNKSYPVHVMNPTPVNQIVGLLFYTRPKLDAVVDWTPADRPVIGSEWDEGLDPEVYLGCMVLRVTPHGAFNVDEEFLQKPIDLSVLSAGSSNLLWINGGRAIFPRGDISLQGYFEAISVSEQKVRAGTTRIADGLGVDVRSAIEADSLRLHPSLFSFPETPLQRQAAGECLCAGARVVGDATLWSWFGLQCN